MSVNLIPVQQLSDEDLIKEVESIPQLLRQKVDLRNAPSRYTDGKDHAKWCHLNWAFVLNRLKMLNREVLFRGLQCNTESEVSLKSWFKVEYPKVFASPVLFIPIKDEIEYNKSVLAKTIAKHHWTRRALPEWAKPFIKNVEEVIISFQPPVEKKEEIVPVKKTKKKIVSKKATVSKAKTVKKETKTVKPDTKGKRTTKTVKSSKV